MIEDKTSITETPASTNKYVDTVKPVYGEYPIKRVLNEENVAEKKKLDKKRKEAEKKAKEKAKNAASKSSTSTDEEGNTESTKSSSTSSSSSNSSSSSSSSSSSTDSSSSSMKSSSKSTMSYGTNTIGAIAAGKKGTESEKLDEILKTIKEDDTTWTDEDGKKKKKTLVKEDLSTSKAQKNPFVEKILRPLQSSMKEGMLEVYETDEENFTPYESTPEEDEKDKDKDTEDEEEDTDDEETSGEDATSDEEEITYHQGEILSTSYYPFNFSYTFDTDYTEGTGESKVDSYIFTDEDLNYIYKGVRVLLKLGWLQFGEKLPTNDTELKKIKADITNSVTAKITKLFNQKWASQKKAYKEYEKTKAEQEAAKAQAEASSLTSDTDEDSGTTTEEN